MRSKTIKFCGSVAAFSLLLVNTAYAFNFGNMMNPSKWMGGNNDNDYYDDYYGGPGYGGPGYGGYGYPGYGGYGYAPSGGYGYPGYGAPGYAAPAYSAPASTGGSQSEEIKQLKARIRKLEQEKQREETPTFGSDTGYTAPPPAYSAQQGMQAPVGSRGGQPGYQRAPASPGGQAEYPTYQPTYANPPAYQFK